MNLVFPGNFLQDSDGHSPFEKGDEGHFRILFLQSHNLTISSIDEESVWAISVRLMTFGASEKYLAIDQKSACTIPVWGMILSDLNQSALLAISLNC